MLNVTKFWIKTHKLCIILHVLYKKAKVMIISRIISAYSLYFNKNLIFIQYITDEPKYNDMAYGKQ